MNAKLHIIYQDGEWDAGKPGTFTVELRKWFCKKTGDVDYILSSEIVTNEKSNKQVSLFSDDYWFKVIATVEALNAANDDGAIRFAVKRYHELEKQSIAMTN